MFRMVGTLYFTDLHFAFTACYCEFILCAYKDSCIQTAQQLVGNNYVIDNEVLVLYFVVLN